MVAESWLRPWDWYNTNVVSFSKLIHCLKDLNITKFLNFSTPEVYGDTRKLIKENLNFNPTTPYAISRAAQDFNLSAYYKSFKFPVVFTRTANIFGPCQQLFRIVPITIIKSMKNQKIFLHGSGKSIRSFIFMEDVCGVLYKILKDKKNIGKTFHISTKKFISIKNLVNLILKLVGKAYMCTTISMLHYVYIYLHSRLHGYPVQLCWGQKGPGTVPVCNVGDT